MSLPTDAKERKGVPVFSGVLAYFPDALSAVARLSQIGNDQHNPGQPLHWSKEKSNDHADCLTRHLLERGTMDTDGVNHSVKVAWRALADLQIMIEAGTPAFGEPEPPEAIRPGKMILTNQDPRSIHEMHVSQGEHVQATWHALDTPGTDTPDNVGNPIYTHRNPNR